MLLTLEVLPAAEGDCLLLHWGTAEKPKIALIDGGPNPIYEEHLRPRLDEIVANRNISQLPLELVMISHVDGDHILGIRRLLRVLRREVEDKIPVADRPLKIRRLWMNIFDDILGNKIDAYYKTLTASVQASKDGAPNPELVEKLADEFEKQGADEEQAEFDGRAVAAVLATVADGRDVRVDHKFLFDANQTAALNNPFTNAQGKPTLITVEKTPAPQDVGGLEFTIVGPMKTEIEKLQEKFDEYIADKGLNIEALLAAYSDRSITNLSSIVCLVEYKGKRIFFTGDARGDKIINGLKAQNLFDDDGKFKVHILKVPHHGSDNNVEPEFFEQIVADVYVLSGDGKNGNPERDTLQWIVDSRGTAEKYEIVLTYEPAEMDPLRKAAFEKNEKKKPNPQPWSHKKHSLQAFFEWTTSEGYAFTLTTNAPRKIDLGDETIDY